MSLIPKRGMVYVVDDDEAVRDSLQWLLEGKGYRVRCFDSAESFLSRYDPREVTPRCPSSLLQATAMYPWR